MAPASLHYSAAEGHPAQAFAVDDREVQAARCTLTGLDKDSQWCVCPQLSRSADEPLWRSFVMSHLRLNGQVRLGELKSVAVRNLRFPAMVGVVDTAMELCVGACRRKRWSHVLVLSA